MLAEDVPTTTALTDIPKTSVTNHTYGLSGWFRESDWLNARLTFRGIDSQVAELGAAVRAEWMAQHLGLDARIDVQPSTLSEMNEYDSAFFLVLGESKPHYKARVDLFKSFATTAGEYSIHLGGDAASSSARPPSRPSTAT